MPEHKTQFSIKTPLTPPASAHHLFQKPSFAPYLKSAPSPGPNDSPAPGQEPSWRGPAPTLPQGPRRSSRSPAAAVLAGPARLRTLGTEEPDPGRRGAPAAPSSPRRHTHRPPPAASPRRRSPVPWKPPRTALAGGAPTPHPKPGSGPFSVGPHAPRLAHPRPAVVAVLRPTAPLAPLRCPQPLARAATSPAARRPGFPDAHVTRPSPRHAGSCSPTAAAPAGRQGGGGGGGRRRMEASVNLAAGLGEGTMARNVNWKKAVRER